MRVPSRVQQLCEARGLGYMLHATSPPTVPRDHVGISTHMFIVSSTSGIEVESLGFGPRNRRISEVRRLFDILSVCHI